MWNTSLQLFDLNYKFELVGASLLALAKSIDYICWYANLWEISFTKDVDWNQLLLCIEPHSCSMHQFLLDNCSIMYNLHKRGSSGYSKKLSTETLITDKFIHPFVSCLLSHPSSFGSFSRSIYFLRKQHYMHPFNKLPVLCLNRLWRWTTSSVSFMEWWPFSVLNGSLLN